MSHSHNKRRKTIRQYKKKYGAKWHDEFVKIGQEVKRKQLGECIGSVSDLLLTR